MSTNLVSYIAAFFIAGVVVFAVLGGEELGWGAGMTFLVVGIAAVVVITPLVIWMSRRKKRRVHEFGAFATRMGMQLVPEHGPALLALPFRLFSLGAGREMESVGVRTVGGHQVWTFDFTYYQEGYNPQSNSRTRHDYEHTCAVMQVAPNTPSMVIAREGVFSRIARAVGFDDVEVGDEAFDREFKVRSSDPVFARAVLHPDMRAWLLSLDPRWTFELAGGYLLGAAHRLPIPQLLVPEEMTFAFLARVPGGLLAGSAGAQP